MDLRKTPVTGIPACLAVPFKVFNDRKKRDNSRAVTLTWSNKDLRALYVPQKCRPQNKSRARARERGGFADQRAIARQLGDGRLRCSQRRPRRRRAVTLTEIGTSAWCAALNPVEVGFDDEDRKSTRLNSSHSQIS